MTPETWYVLVDGSAGDPRVIRPGADGVLRHMDGRAVEYRAHGPRSRGVDADEERAKALVAAESAMAMKPAEPKRSYSTRESKAD